MIRKRRLLERSFSYMLENIKKREEEQKVVWEELEKSTNIAGAYKWWEPYRTQLTAYIIEEVEIGDTIAIIGAGECNDIDLSELLPYVSHIKLVDQKKESLQKAVERYQVPEERVEQIELNLWPVSKEEFERKLEQGSSIEELLQFLQEETRKANQQVLQDLHVDVMINIGVYSQLNALLASLFYIKREPYGLSEREQISRMFSYMNQQAVQKINDWLFSNSRKSIIGYEYAVFSTEEKEHKQCQKVLELLQSGQVEFLQTMPMKRVEGGWQGESDLARRYRKREISFKSNRYFIWNFLQEKQYIMQCYTIR